MFSLFSKNNKDEKKPIHSVWNIDSQGVSLMITDDYGSVVFYRSYDHIFSQYDKRNTVMQLEDSIIKNLEKIFYDIQRRNLPFPETADVVLGEPWSHSITRKVHHTRKTNFVVSRQIVKDLIIRDIQTIDKNRYAYDISSHTEFSKPYIHSVSISGYMVTMWEGKKTSDVRIEYSIGFFDKKITQTITQKIHEQLKVKMLQIKFHNYQIIHYDYWEKTITVPSLIIYPSGLLTSIFWIEKKNLKAFGTIPVGTHVLYEQLKNDLGVSYQEINTLSNLIDRNSTDNQLLKKMKMSFQKGYEDWEYVFQKFCSQLVNDGMSLEQIIWMGGGTQQIIQPLMKTVQHDSASFPIIFGSQKINFIQGGPLFISSASMRDVDRVIIHWLSNK